MKLGYFSSILCNEKLIKHLTINIKSGNESKASLKIRRPITKKTSSYCNGTQHHSYLFFKQKLL